MKQRAIVSSFISIAGLHAQAERFLLMKRSSHSRPHPEAWGICSGKIDPSDSSVIDAAVREIREETSLHVSAKFHLGAAGPVRVVQDEQGQVEWIIYPLLWTMATQDFCCPQMILSQVILNDEHTQAILVTKQEFANRDVVPGLYDTLLALLKRRRAHTIHTKISKACPS